MPRDCEKCPLAWDERYYDDSDFGCFVNQHMDVNKWCYIPKWICKIKYKLLLRKENLYWEKDVKQLEEDFNNEQ